MYKAVHGTAPSYICELVEKYVPIRALRSSNNDLYLVPKSCLKSFGDRAFSICAPILWNTLPIALRNSNSLDSFKEDLKTYLF